MHLPYILYLILLHYQLHVIICHIFKSGLYILFVSGISSAGFLSAIPFY